MFILKTKENFFKGKMMRNAVMNPKTLQYLMGHSDISVTMNVYTHVNFDDAEEELKRMESFRLAQKEIDEKMTRDKYRQRCLGQAEENNHPPAKRVDDYLWA